MIRTKLIKGFLFGLCMTAMVTGTAFAKASESTKVTTSKETVSEERQALNDKQEEIEKYVFTDHPDEIAKKGITVHYIAISDEGLEIGISPYDDSTKKFFYDTFGNEDITLVDFDESILYATTVQAPDAATDTEVLDNGKTSGAQDADDTAAEKESTGAEEDVKIQIESTQDSTDEVEQEKVYKTTSADDNENKTVSVEDSSTEEAKKNDGISAPIMVLIIAGGAALIGSAIIVLKKKN